MGVDPRRWVLLHCSYCTVCLPASVRVNGCHCVDLCLCGSERKKKMCRSLTVNKCVWELVLSIRQVFSKSFSRAPLSLHQVCVFVQVAATENVSVYVCVCVCDCKCLSEEEQENNREKEWVMRDGRERGDRERLKQRCYGSSSISSLLFGPWATQLPSQPLLCRPLSTEFAMRSAGTFRFNLPLTPLASTSLQKWLK